MNPKIHVLILVLTVWALLSAAPFLFFLAAMLALAAFFSMAFPKVPVFVSSMIAIFVGFFALAVFGLGGIVVVAVYAYLKTAQTVFGTLFR